MASTPTIKLLPILLFLLTTAQIFGQKTITPTDEFKITGLVKQEMTIKLSDLKKYPDKKIKNVAVTNHLGEKKGTAKKLRGVAITDLLKTVEIQTDSPRNLSQFYLIFEASDGYKVVYSWNEIFNSPTGSNVFVVTQKDGENIEMMKDRIIIITPTDFQTGRRYVKGLSKITVARI